MDEYHYTIYIGHQDKQLYKQYSVDFIIVEAINFRHQVHPDLLN